MVAGGQCRPKGDGGGAWWELCRWGWSVGRRWCRHQGLVASGPWEIMHRKGLLS